MNQDDHPQDGSHRELFADGTLSGEGTYWGGRKHGRWEYWYKSGQRKAVGEYLEGELDGPWQWWRENGQPLQTGGFVKGVQVGYWRRYYDNGQLWDAGAYEGGRKVGPWTVYDRAGALKQSTVFKLRKPKPVEPGAPAVGEARSVPTTAEASAAQVRMHAEEIPIDTELVRRLLSEQFPHLADRPITMIRSTGTVNALCVVGEDRCVRLSRVAIWADGLTRELTWLPQLAPHLSLRIPTPIAAGKPTPWYPYPWAVYSWIDGSTYQDDLVRDEAEAANDLATFIQELRRIDPSGAPRAGRAPLTELDQVTRARIEESAGTIDAEAVLAAWNYSLQTRPWDGKGVWIHGDLLRSNLLLKEGRLGAVIDFGGVGVGDPAADIMPAWTVFGKVGRTVFRQALGVDDHTWARSRGYALHQAVLIIPYYMQTNPLFVDMATRTVDELLADF